MLSKINTISCTILGAVIFESIPVALKKENKSSDKKRLMKRL